MFFPLHSSFLREKERGGKGERGEEMREKGEKTGYSNTI